MKCYAHKGHIKWLKNNQDEGRTRCIVVYSFKEFEDDEEFVI